MSWWSKRSEAKARGMSQLREDIHQATLRIKQLEDSLLALEDKHERLRGRFYATRPPDSPPAPESKAEILRRMGFMR